MLPQETWTPISSSIALAGTEFKAFKDANSLKLEVDVNGDGRLDKAVKGNDGYLVLERELEGGDKEDYAVRFRVASNKYEYASSGVLEGSLGKTQITLIDQNNDGRFDEFGVDAMIVGRERAASFLSKVVNLDGDLYELSIDGLELSATPYEGEAGVLDLEGGFESKGKLEAVVVSDANGNSFELASHRKGLRVPAGDYRIVGGLVSKANETVRIGAGKSKPIVVRPDGETDFEWGGPLIAEIAFTHFGEEVKIEPTALQFYGKAGEEYLDFLPQGASPKFFVHDAETGKEVGTGRYGGC